MKANRLVLLAAATASAIALTGCTPAGDVAVEVGKVKYSTSDVDLLTTFQCEIASDPNAGAGALSRQSARAFMASILVASALDGQIGEKYKVKAGPADAASSMEQLNSFIDKAATGDDRKRLRTIVEDSIIGQVAVSTVVQQAIGQSLQQMSQEQAQQAIQEGITKLRLDAAKSADIEVDPVYGLSADGLEPAKTDPSLSRALSDFAKESMKAPVDQAWLEKLPANQRCS
ncbi:hypothetical protein EFK50_17940 [Nocardioides marmoriginsengisoli]|uniref:Lipoprotein n=1 Tax=Nocardioides marmoriginsengisoli TaxID=661483 RepID=A0A3N0CCV5_9ACTN|nr:hypothetical protein [Nocardioides marmoriginsengisoli]RNL61248.1 hypothetical protein EFK50_17940 [Nocardioides marmoriginsengisoli]